MSVTDIKPANLAGLRPVTWDTQVYTYYDGFKEVTVSGPCDACGQTVTVEEEGMGRYLRRLHLFCSERCRGRYYSRVRSERTAITREKVCEVCDKDFTATRKDQKTCSPACKQAAYRIRKKRKEC